MDDAREVASVMEPRKRGLADHHIVLGPQEVFRLVGAALTWTEGRLRAAGFDAYGGGILLFAALATISVAVVLAILAASSAASWLVLWMVHTFFLSACSRSGNSCATFAGSRPPSAKTTCPAHGAA